MNGKVGPVIAYHLSKEHASLTLLSRTQVLYSKMTGVLCQKSKKREHSFRSAGILPALRWPDVWAAL